MHTPYVLLQWLARSLVRHGRRALDGSLAEVLPDVASEVWPRWAGGTNEAQLRTRLQTIVRAPDRTLANHARLLVQRVAHNLPEEERDGLIRYLRLVPTSIRGAIRRPADPSGTTIPTHFPLRRAEDLLPLLPLRLSHHGIGGDNQSAELLGCTAAAETWLVFDRGGERTGCTVHRLVLDPGTANAVRQRSRHLAGLVEAADVRAARLRDFGVERRQPLLAYEWVPGGNLATLIREWHHWQPSSAVQPPWFFQSVNRFMLDLAETVATCHRLDPPLAHGHLKPCNVLVRREGGRLRPLLTDLGVSDIMARHALESRRTDSLLCASPQQRAGHDPLPSDDVFSLGVIWTQILTGDLAARTKALGGPGLPAPMLALLRSCVADDPAVRPADAAVLAERLSEILGSARDAVPVPRQAAVPQQRTPVVIVCAAGRGQYQSIQEAVRKAPLGARLMIRPGVYKESITLTRRVELVGEGPAGTVVIESDNGDCIHASTVSGAAVRNLTLRCRAATQGKKYYCVEVTGNLLLENCDLTSDSLACLAVHGPRAFPEVRRCTLHDGQMGGAFFFNNAGGLLEDCDIGSNRFPGVEITGGANPTVRRCRVHHQTEHNGAMVYNGGRGTFEDCDIFANKYANVRVHADGNPTLRRCKIHDGLSCGVFITAKGRGLLEECEVFNHANAEVEVSAAGTNPTLRRCKLRGAKMAGLFFYDGACGLVELCDVSGSATAVVEFKSGAEPVLKRCKIHGGQNTGVLLWENCRGTFEECHIFGHSGVGVSIKNGGDPAFRKCRVRDGLKGGVLIGEKGRGSFEDCDLSGNALPNLEVGQHGEPVLKRCRLRTGKQGGVLVRDEGQGTFEECDISGNGQTGLEVRTGGNPTLTRCRIREGRQGGVVVFENGKGRLEECEISGNALAAVEIHQGGHLVLTRCRIERGKQPGVWVHQRGVGTVEHCELSGESGDAWRLEDGCRVHRHGNKE